MRSTVVAFVVALAAGGCEDEASCPVAERHSPPPTTAFRTPLDGVDYRNVLVELQCTRLATCGLIWPEDVAACQANHVGRPFLAGVLWTGAGFDPAVATHHNYHPDFAAECLAWLADVPCLAKLAPPSACSLALVDTSGCDGCADGEICRSCDPRFGMGYACGPARGPALERRYYPEYGGNCSYQSAWPSCTWPPCPATAGLCESCAELGCDRGMVCDDGVCARRRAAVAASAASCSINVASG